MIPATFDYLRPSTVEDGTAAILLVDDPTEAIAEWRNRPAFHAQRRPEIVAAEARARVQGGGVPAR